MHNVAVITSCCVSCRVFLYNLHGTFSIYLQARAYMKEEHVRHVKETLDWVMFHQFPSGNLRSSVGSKEDKLIHWCHGAAGAIFLFLEASKVNPLFLVCM